MTYHGRSGGPVWDRVRICAKDGIGAPPGSPQRSPSGAARTFRLWTTGRDDAPGCRAPGDVVRDTASRIRPRTSPRPGPHWRSDGRGGPGPAAARRDPVRPNHPADARYVVDAGPAQGSGRGGAHAAAGAALPPRARGCAPRASPPPRLRPRRRHRPTRRRSPRATHDGAPYEARSARCRRRRRTASRWPPQPAPTSAEREEHRLGHVLGLIP